MPLNEKRFLEVPDATYIYADFYVNSDRMRWWKKLNSRWPRSTNLAGNQHALKTCLLYLKHLWTHEPADTIVFTTGSLDNRELYSCSVFERIMSTITGQTVVLYIIYKEIYMYKCIYTHLHVYKCTIKQWSFVLSYYNYSPFCCFDSAWYGSKHWEE